MSEDTQRPRADAIYEELMRSEFLRGLSPEAWVARYRHTLHLGGILEVSYSNHALDDWVQSVERIVNGGHTDIDQLRRTHLSFWQRRTVRREERAEHRWLGN